MDDLISRAAAKEAIHDKIVSASTVVRIWNILNSVPAVDATPVVHGRWVISPGCLWPIGDCSVCGEQHIGTNSAKYCPNCGARMDGEVDA